MWAYRQNWTVSKSCYFRMLIVKKKVLLYLKTESLFNLHREISTPQSFNLINTHAHTQINGRLWSDTTLVLFLRGSTKKGAPFKCAILKLLQWNRWVTKLEWARSPTLQSAGSLWYDGGRLSHNHLLMGRFVTLQQSFFGWQCVSFRQKRHLLAMKNSEVFSLQFSWEIQAFFFFKPPRTTD